MTSFRSCVVTMRQTVFGERQCLLFAHPTSLGVSSLATVRYCYDGVCYARTIAFRKPELVTSQSHFEIRVSHHVSFFIHGDDYEVLTVLLLMRNQSNKCKIHCSLIRYSNVFSPAPFEQF